MTDVGHREDDANEGESLRSPLVQLLAATPLTPQLPAAPRMASFAGPVTPRLERPVIPMEDDSRCVLSAAAGYPRDHRGTSGPTPDGQRRGADGLASSRDYFNPARRAIYVRYSTNDWVNHNRAHQRQTCREQINAEHLRSDAWMAVRHTDQRTRNRQGEASKKLIDRVKDIEGQQTLLEKEIKLNETETMKLLDHLRQLEAALGNTANPLLVAEECLTHREKRIGIDLVKDEVERLLNREVECIRRCQAQMRRLAEKGRDQARRNRAALHELDKDLRNKSHARTIDDRLCQLQNSSPSIALYPGIEAVDNSVSIPDSWARFSQENVAKSQRCRNTSEKLRVEIEALMRGCSNEMWSHFTAANEAFAVRIREINEARSSLICQLQRTLAEIFAAETSVTQVRKALADKEAPMKVAQTRLEERNRRLNVELCNDVATATLQREVQEIRDSQKILIKRLKSLEAALSRLNRTRSTLEADIRVKEMSLHIDAKCCMGMRRSYSMEPKAGLNFGSILNS